MSAQLRLMAFSRQFYDQLIGWIPHETFLLLWGGPLYQWPLTAVQIDSHLADEAVSALLLLDDNEPIGFCELILESPGSYRLCRVLVGPACLRGRGLGKQLVKLAIEYARLRLSANRLALYVFEDNLSAIHCYLSQGFEVASAAMHGHLSDGKPRNVLRMERQIA